ncbi:RNA-guided endonuclease InsQ/TnpB family protein [Helicobacter suis]|uniref:RNA-guided endonuclease InsQ/TnpB family protein n=1 Tax=Helicobacter suis TaxID=104628 RepID=UPI0013D7BC32|nr:RNA-guided endonuclease TnpB family protein [Helicobacter suis]
MSFQITHKVQLSPNNKAKTYFKKACGCARLAYNWGLARWKENYNLGIKTNHLALKKEFNAIKKEQFPFVYEVSKYATQQPFIHLGLAFTKFFRDLKQGKLSYPRFKKKREFQGKLYIGGDQIKIIQGCKRDYLKIPNLSKIKMTEKLRFVGKISGATISIKGSDFFVSIAMEVSQKEFISTHKPLKNSKTIGIDTGIKSFVSLSNGLQIKAPKPLTKLTRRLKRLSRQLSKKQHPKAKGDKTRKSRNYLLASLKLNKLHQRISNIRLDFLHKLTSVLVSHFDLFCLENLRVDNMLKNHKLAKSLADVSISAFNTLLEYKARYLGKEIKRADSFYPSSKTCSDCGHLKTDLSLSDRVYSCSHCGLVLDRDYNASLNLVKHLVGKALTEFTPADMTALLADLKTNQLVTSMVETGIQQKSHALSL